MWTSVPKMQKTPTGENEMQMREDPTGQINVNARNADGVDTNLSYQKGNAPFTGKGGERRRDYQSPTQNARQKWGMSRYTGYLPIMSEKKCHAGYAQ